MPLSPGTRLGPYEITVSIGAGGMGEVYRARESKLNRDVAVKVLPDLFARDPDRLSRFEREAQTLAAVSHPNIAHVFGVLESPPALIMEFVDGEDLAQRLSRGSISVEDALAIAKQMADALEAAHERGIIHRDLKPANVKVGSGGGVKVLDFGLAKALDGRPDAPRDEATFTSPALLTNAGMIVGTAAYMSPEQAKGRPADRRSDIWAFGCVLFEMLAGRRPFDAGGDAGGSIAETLAGILKSDVQWTALPAATPPRVRALLRRCLEKDPRRRLQAIGEARVQLEDAIADTPDAAPPSTPPRRSALSVFAMFAAFLSLPLLAAIAVVLATRTPPASPAAAPVHFTIPIEDPFRGIAISPDGSQIVFGARQGNTGALALWLRKLDAADAEVLAGTVDGYSPMWSPDGRSIAFFAGGRLKRLDLASRGVQSLTPAAVGLQPTRGWWSADNSIYYFDLSTGMMRMAAAGGSPQAMPLDNPAAVSRFMSIQVLPDTRRFLVVHGGPNSSGTYLGTIGSPAVTRIHEERATFLPPDHLLITRDDSVVLQQVDAASMKAVGPARTVLFGGIGPLGVSAGTLAYRTGGNAATELTWFDRAGKSQGTLGGVGDYYMPRLSPDGKRVSFEAHNTSGNGDLHVFDIAGGVSTRLTFDPTHHNAGAIWSPAGDRVIFHSTRDGMSLYAKSLAGVGTEQQILKSPAANPMDWSPDGAVALVDLTRGDRPGLYEMRVDRPGEVTPVVVVPGATVIQGQFSPDGKWIAYTSDESSRHEIYLSPYPATGAKLQVSDAGGVSPRWNRNGKEIFYLNGDTMMAVPIALGASVPVGKPQKLFDAPIRTRGQSDFFQYDVAPDGQRFLAVAFRNAREPLHVIVNWRSLIQDK